MSISGQSCNEVKCSYKSNSILKEIIPFFSFLTFLGATSTFLLSNMILYFKKNKFYSQMGLTQKPVGWRKSSIHNKIPFIKYSSSM
jgi:hypothetical protein